MQPNQSQSNQFNEQYMEDMGITVKMEGYRLHREHRVQAQQIRAYISNDLCRMIHDNRGGNCKTGRDGTQVGEREA